MASCRSANHRDWEKKNNDNIVFVNVKFALNFGKQFNYFKCLCDPSSFKQSSFISIFKRMFDTVVNGVS